MEKKSPRKALARLTREAWLDQALKVLAREGYAAMEIARITRKLRVTKGSFYWHFKDRSDFRKAVVDHWDQMYTRRVATQVEAEGGSAAERLRRTLETVSQENLSGYDAPIDGWGSRDPAIAARVQQAHEFRYRYIRSLFSEMGFARADLDTRTVACLGLLKLEKSMPPGNETRPTPARIDAWMRFLTGA